MLRPDGERDQRTDGGAHPRGGGWVAGPIRVTLSPPTGGTASGCLSGLDSVLLGALVANPSGFYVNVHTTDFPAGALRGQLQPLSP